MVAAPSATAAMITSNSKAQGTKSQLPQPVAAELDAAPYATAAMITSNSKAQETKSQLPQRAAVEPEVDTVSVPVPQRSSKSLMSGPRTFTVGRANGRTTQNRGQQRGQRQVRLGTTSRARPAAKNKAKLGFGSSRSSRIMPQNFSLQSKSKSLPRT